MGLKLTNSGSTFSLSWKASKFSDVPMLSILRFVTTKNIGSLYDDRTQASGFVRCLGYGASDQRQLWYLDRHHDGQVGSTPRSTWSRKGMERLGEDVTRIGAAIQYCGGIRKA